MTTLSALLSEWLKVFDGHKPPVKQRPFDPEKELCEADQILVTTLNSEGHEDVCYCVCDPAGTDCPIIFASDGFCSFTGYDAGEIEGRNCRFLQGEGTDPTDVSRIRDRLKEFSTGQTSKPASVNLLNYRKDGTSFCNEFFLAPLRDHDYKICYLIGIQCPVSKLGPGQAPSNPGWVYSQANYS